MYEVGLAGDTESHDCEYIQIRRRCHADNEFPWWGGGKIDSLQNELNDVKTTLKSTTDTATKAFDNFKPLEINGNKAATFSEVIFGGSFYNKARFFSFAGTISDNPFTFISGIGIALHCGLLYGSSRIMLIATDYNGTKWETKLFDQVTSDNPDDDLELSPEE